jgi:stage V sporulation protein R
MSEDSKLLFTSGADWNEELLRRCWEECKVIAQEDMRQTYYEPQIEVVSAAQMLEAYTSSGLPVWYSHWSYGKELVKSEADYKKGLMGLAYEIVINSNPCIAYLMEENNALVQLLVIAHASIGHSAVFKNNFMFKNYTDAAGIVSYLSFARRYILMCEERYGVDEVEAVLDACHALSLYGTDSAKRNRALNSEQEEKKAIERFAQQLYDYDAVWQKVGKGLVDKAKADQAPPAEDDEEGLLAEPQENLLYFIEKHGKIPAWKKELIRINRMIAQYFDPQRKTKVLNEGYATFTHYYILNRLYDKGLIDEGSMHEFFRMHSGVIAQRAQAAFNPYKLGFEIFMSLKAACEDGCKDPDDEPYHGHLKGQPWQDVLQEAMMNYTDETFILQFLAPSVAKKLEMFAIRDHGLYDEEYLITEVARPESFRELRAKLAAQYHISRYKPDIQVIGNDDDVLRLKHFVVNNRPLNEEQANDVIAHASYLWGGTVKLTMYIDDGDGETSVPHVIMALNGARVENSIDIGWGVFTF